MPPVYWPCLSPIDKGGQYDRPADFPFHSYVMDTLWLFRSLPQRRPKDMLAVDIIFCRSASM